MAIRNLTPATVTAFTGKNTVQNMTDAAAGTLLSAKNILINADNQIRKAPGYTLVATMPNGGPVRSIFSFERAVDAKQFVFVQSGSEILQMQTDGSAIKVMSTGETSAEFQFVQNAFACYASNGAATHRFVDVGGTLTTYNWGVAVPATAPTIALSAGTLTLQFGRRYVVCGVSKYTDSLGVQRVQVGPPSAMTAHTGPITNELVTLGSIAVSTDPQVNYQWIFATSDSPVATSATFFFAAEIANGTTAWGDSLPDSSLDQTRLAPYDNNPAPPSALLTTFQNRVAAVQVNQLRLSGYSEIALGIPEESWPLSLFFNVPAGARRATAVSSLGQGTLLTVDTLDAKFGYSGYDASTFTEQDGIAAPGAVGKWAQTMTPFGLVYLSESKRLYIWNGNGNSAPTELSSDIAVTYPGTYGMEDLDEGSLSEARLAWYGYGLRHFLVLLARTSDAPDANLNLIQIWSIPVKGSQSSGMYTGSSAFFNQIGGLYQTDKIAVQSFTAMALVKVNSVPYLFLGDANGNIFRFPDGFTDNGTPYAPNFSTPWSLLGEDAEKRFYFADLYVQSPTSLDDSGGPVANFKMYAAVAGSAEDPVNYIELALQILPDPKQPSVYALRGNLQVDGLNVGKYIRLAVQLPDDLADEVVLKMTVWHAPLYAGVA